ncbi:MAG: hypothetical protein WCO25_05380 [Candidatus Uhrbacteria bacterium]
MVLRLVLTELFDGIVSLPAWWYTRGLAIMTAWFQKFVRDASERFSLGVWVRNLFVPMYGDTEWSGRAISFGVRFAMIFVRGGAVAVWSSAAFVGLAVYVLALPMAILGLLYHAVGLIVF